MTPRGTSTVDLCPTCEGHGHMNFDGMVGEEGLVACPDCTEPGCDYGTGRAREPGEGGGDG